MDFLWAFAPVVLCSRSHLDLADGKAGVDGVVGGSVLIGEVSRGGCHIVLLEAKGQRLIGSPVHNIVKVGCWNQVGGWKRV